MKRGGLRRKPHPTRPDAFSNRRQPLSKASAEQREKVAAAGECAACGYRAPFVDIDPAHLSARGYRGGCNAALCVLPLCRSCHERLDDPSDPFDLLARLAPGEWIAELQHALEPQHYNRDLVSLLERLTGTRWEPVTETER